MAKQAITSIKNWFLTGLKPTQTQFWDWMDSYWHKDEQIPIAKIDGVQPIYDSINNHLNDANAHVALLNKSRIYPFETFQIFKKEGNNDEQSLEIGDYGAGYIDTNTFIPPSKFLGVDPYDLASWEIISGNPPVENYKYLDALIYYSRIDPNDITITILNSTITSVTAVRSANSIILRSPDLTDFTVVEPTFLIGKDETVSGSLPWINIQTKYFKFVPTYISQSPISGVFFAVDETEDYTNTNYVNALIKLKVYNNF